MSYAESQLDDALDIIKAQLKHMALELMRERHKELVTQHQQVLYRVTQLEKELEELKKKQVIWEK